MLAACVTRNPEGAREFAEKHAIAKVYASFDQLADDPDIDIVYLATPNSLHYPQAKQALLAGKHVLCEKPLALSRAHGLELIDIATRANRLLKVAYQFRFEQVFMRVRDLIRAGTLGDIRSVRLFGSAAVATANPGWRQTPQEGGILSDLAVHFLDLVPWLTGLEFTDISARAIPRDTEHDVTQIISILGTLGDSCDSFIAASRGVTGGQNSLSIEGTKATVVVPAWRGAEEFELVLQGAGGRTVEKIAPAPMFEREIEAVEDARDGKSTALATAMDGVRTIVLAEAVGESARTGRAVSVAQWRDACAVPPSGATK